MSANAIILTNGQTGSSVLAGLLTRCGYWAGAATVRKSDYDTFQNTELVRLNRVLLDGLGIAAAPRHDPDLPRLVCDLAERIDLAPFHAFLADCDRHRPWVWKDPWLWATFRFWCRLLDGREFRAVHMTREPLQAWISANLHRQFQSYGFLKVYSAGVNATVPDEIRLQQQRYFSLSFEDLILRPSGAISQLNDFLRSRIRIGELKALYDGPLYQMPRGGLDLVGAILIYLRHRGHRLG